MEIDFELVVPAYNEAKSIPLLVQRTVAAAKKFGFNSDSFRLVIVQNGSTDESQKVLTEIHRSSLGEWIRIVEVPVNQGYGFGLYSGLQTTTARFVGWTHADLQCLPEDAFKAILKLKECKEPNVLVKGVRRGRNWKDRFVSRVFELFARILLGLKVYEINAQPKVFPRFLLDSLRNPPKTFALDLYLLYHAKKGNFSTQVIEVEFPPRIHGTSKWAMTFFSRFKTISGIIRYMKYLASTEGKL